MHRFSNDSHNRIQQDQVLTGSLLLAHPTLQDTNFRQAVVLLTAHSGADGALGVVVNRPLHKTLGDYEPALRDTEFAQVPLYDGGPVAQDQLILVAWKWADAEAAFKLYFGIDEKKAASLLAADAGYQFRGFLGHSGWGKGQLEDELDGNAWLVSPLAKEIEDQAGTHVWRRILRRVSPRMQLLADEPDDLSLN
jgi:putative transcriptional regulator